MQSMTTTHTCSTNDATPSGISGYYRQLLRVQQPKSLPKSTKYAIRHQSRGYLIADTEPVDSKSSWWTLDQAKAQVYYNPEVAFYKAGIVSSMLDVSVDVCVLD